MAYKHSLADDAPVTKKDFIEAVNFIETVFTDKTAAMYKGARITYLRDAFCRTFFVKTTMSDLRSVRVRLPFCWLSDNVGEFTNPIVSRIREPKKGEFRNRLKFTPSKAFAYDFNMLCSVDKDAENYADLAEVKCKWLRETYPVIQDEDFLTTTCNKAFDNNDADIDYGYVLRNAISFLDRDKRISLNPGKLKTEAAFELSERIQTGISLMYESTQTWQIVYKWRDIDFLFPVSHDEMLSILKSRDPVDGRRKALPTTVKKHSRKGRLIDQHVTNVWNDAPAISMDGREFLIYLAPEIYSDFLLNTSKNRERMRELLEDAI